MFWLIHIGAPKTGSTAIQRMLFNGREALLEQGVLYPDVSLRGFGHHDLAFLLDGAYPAWATRQERSLDDLAGDLAREVETTGARSIVLSSENFYLYPQPERLLALLQRSGFGAGDQVRVLCYVRRQDEAHLSWYNQTVKAQGNRGSLAATIRRDHGLWDYERRLSAWVRIFGAEAIVVRDYSAFVGEGDDIRRDILELLSVPPGALPLPPIRDNGRINNDALAFQRLLNWLPLSPVSKRRFHKQLIAFTAAHAGTGAFDEVALLGADERRAVIAAYAASNDRLAAFVGKRQGFFSPAQLETSAAVPCRRLVLRRYADIVRWLIAHRNSDDRQ